MNLPDPVETISADEARESASSLVAGSLYSNFELLNSDGTWSTTWTDIVSGRFTNSPYSSLFFYEAGTGHAELHETDGQGHLILVRKYRLFERKTWTHIVPGIYGGPGYTGLLLYDQSAGVGAIYISDGQDFYSSTWYADWRLNWSHIVSGYFKYPATWNNVRDDETYAGLFFYSQADQYAEIWATDGTGHVSGDTPFATYSDLDSWTHIVAGDFVMNEYTTDQLTDVLCYNANDGTGQLMRSRFDRDITGQQRPMDMFKFSGLPSNATNVVAGNFGGSGMANVLFHNRNTGVINIGSITPSAWDVNGNVMGCSYFPLETLVYPRPSADLVVPGNFYMEDQEDVKFVVGDNQNNEQLRNWRASPGGFTDLVFYDWTAGLGEFYLKEPKVPPPDSLTGYITSTTRHGPHGTLSVATGSVLPGETITFHISNQVPPYTSSISIYRATDEDFVAEAGNVACGAHHPDVLLAVPRGTPLAQINNLTTPPQPINRGAYRHGAQWGEAASFAIPSWSSGLYVARVSAPGTDGSMVSVDLPFVVRSKPAGSQSKILVVIADTRDEAYNDWGGRGFYGYQNPEDPGGAVHPQSGVRAPYAFTVSFDRPYAGRYDCHQRFNPRTGKWKRRELAFLKWLELQGIAVEVCTLRDLEFDTPSSNYRLLVFVGHPEYWSWNMRYNVQNFAMNGGNLAFYAGNVCWWQVRLSSDGTKMTCYKNKTFDPFGGTGNFAYTTVNWYDDPVKQPETSLTGVSYYPAGTAVNYGGTAVPFQVSDASHWTMHGTGLSNFAKFGMFTDELGQNTSVIGVGGAVGGEGETDRIQHNPEMVSPSNFHRIAWSTAAGQTAEMGTIGIFTPNNGASYVFTAATTNWSLGLSRSTEVHQITLNTVIGLSGSFHQLPGLARDVAVGPTGAVYVIGTDAQSGGFGIYSWNGSGWSSVATFGAARIAVDPAGQPWVVDDTGAIKHRSRKGHLGWIWTTVAGEGTDVGVGAKGDVWVIGTDRSIYKWTGSDWEGPVQIDGGASRIAVDQTGNPWVINGPGDVYQRMGGVSGSWQQVPRIWYRAAGDIGIGPDGSVWVCGGFDDGYTISRSVAGLYWARVPGAALNISVGPNGPWITNESYVIWNWS